MLEYEEDCIEDARKSNIYTNSENPKKNQMDGLKQLLQRYVRTLPVFDFNGEKYDLNLLSHIYSVSQIKFKKIIFLQFISNVKSN